MAKRIKVQPIATRETFEQVVNSISALQAGILRLEAERDAHIAALQKSYGAMTAPLQAQIDAAATCAEAYAEDHRSELLTGDRKSVDLATATFGWRTGMRAVKPINRKTSEEDIIRNLEGACLDDYVREVKQIAKDKILADCKDGATLSTLAIVDRTSGKIVIPAESIALAEVGLKIVQAETFFIEPKTETAETIKAPEAKA